MFKWVQNLALKWAISFIKGKIKDAGEDVNIFMLNLYSMNIADFMTYCMETLSKKDLKIITFPEYLKQIIVPLDDNVEEPIVKVIDGLKP